MAKKRVYIAGPMTGKKWYNAPAFDQEEDFCSSLGWDVVNPVNLDRDAGFDPHDFPEDHDWHSMPEGVTRGNLADRDLPALASCDAIWMLPGWRESTGAMAEYHVAKWRGMEILGYELDEAEGEEGGTDAAPSTAEERKRTPIASGVLDYFPDAIRALARCSWVGNQQHNSGEPLHWARGKSDDHADCLMRHFMERGTIDTDGIPHSVKVLWRAAAITQLELESKD